MHEILQIDEKNRATLEVYVEIGDSVESITEHILKVYNELKDKYEDVTLQIFSDSPSCKELADSIRNDLNQKVEGINVIGLGF